MASATVAMNFKQTEALGMQAIGDTSTTQKHPLGTVVKATDATYGDAKFIYAKGVASTALGDLCTIDNWGAATVRAVTSTGAIGCLGVAMSANVASQYGWYMVEGSALVNANTSTAVGALYLSSTAGTVDSAKTTHSLITGMVCTLREGSNVSYAGTGKCVAQLAWPSVNNMSISTI
jgi:hypothetical protein